MWQKSYEADGGHDFLPAELADAVDDLIDVVSQTGQVIRQLPHVALEVRRVVVDGPEGQRRPALDDGLSEQPCRKTTNM